MAHVIQKLLREVINMKKIIIIFSTLLALTAIAWALGNIRSLEETLFIDGTNGRVGVNDSTPDSAFDVVGDAEVSGDLTVDSTTLHVDSSNNRVGVNTATPNKIFHINNSLGEATRFQITNADTGTLLSDGLDIGLDTDESVLFKNRENTDMSFWTNNTQRMVLDSEGNLEVNGDMLIDDEGGTTALDFGEGVVFIRSNRTTYDRDGFRISTLNASGDPESRLTITTGANDTDLNEARVEFSSVNNYVFKDGFMVIKETGGNGGNVPHECEIRTNSGTTSLAVPCTTGEIAISGGVNCATSLKESYASLSSGIPTEWYGECETPGTILVWSYCCDY